MKKQFSFLLFFICLLNASSQTLDTSFTHAMEGSIKNGTYPNIHSILVSHQGKLVYENYWPGYDEKFGKSLGVIPHYRDQLHCMRSMTKSVTSICVGIALAQGKIKSIDQRVFEFFPEHASKDTGLRSKITIRHLLNMTAGFTWDEDDYTRPDNAETLMSNAPDPAAHMLSLPVESDPGKIFVYNGGATQLLAMIIQKATGLPLDTFASRYLFKPLEIKKFEWGRMNASNMPDAFSSLYLSSVDMLKIGLLYLHDGKWKNKQVVPASWVKESIKPSIVADDGSDPRFGKSEYGYQWWIIPDTVRNKAVSLAACIGNGGQRIFIDKENKLVVVFTGGNYNKPDLYLNPFKILNRFIYPGLM